MSVSPANLERLIEVFTDETPEEREEREYAELRSRQSRKRPPKKSGWRKGQPRCGACPGFIGTPTAVCGMCGYDNGLQRYPL